MNYAFYVSSKATRLSKILKENSDFLKRVKVIFSDDKENEYLKEKLNNLNIKYVLYDYVNLDCSQSKKNERLSDLLLKTLDEYKIDYCFSFGAHILKGKLLNAYKYKIINFHPSLLPDYPGVKAIDQALNNKARYIGNTAHFIDAGIDTGPIILQSIQLSEVFYKEGYDGILDVQIEMLYKIDLLLIEKKIVIENSKVKILGANYKINYFFPHIG